MKVLFIGGTGNISTSVSKHCLDKGVDLYLLNRGITENVIDNVKILKCDINDVGSVKDILKSHEWDAVVNWIAYDTSDIERDLSLFGSKTKQYIFISSVSVYQKPPQQPIITENTLLSNPYWQYSRNKIECEKRLVEEYEKNNFPFSIVRPGLTYNTMIPVPFGGYTVIDRMINGKEIVVHGDGTSIWAFTHSEDFAKGFIGLLGREDSIGEAYHITTDELICWNQAYQFMGEAVGVEPKLVHITSDKIIKHRPDLEGILIGEWSNSMIFDNSKIKSFVPDYEAKISFKDGIKKTLDWYRAEESRMIINKKDNETFNRLLNLYG